MTDPLAGLTYVGESRIASVADKEPLPVLIAQLKMEVSILMA